MNDVLRIAVAGEEYMIDVAHVLEVAVVPHPTPVPGSNRQLLGLWNRRGEILPMFDLAQVIGIAGSAERQAVVVARRGDLVAGLAVDAVHGVTPRVEGSDDHDEPGMVRRAVLDRDRLVGELSIEQVFEALATGGTDG